jgi:alanine dehydrogenase
VTARDPEKLAALEHELHGRVATRVINADVLAELLSGADVLIGAVWTPTGVAPKLVSREMVRSMGEGAVIVDVGIDMGGICETSRETSHHDPVYVEEGVVHYCVPNMPGAVPITSTEALTNASLPYVLELADRGLDALRGDEALAHGANTVNGHLTKQSVADALSLPCTPLAEALSTIH